jgi:hypothetical protein
MRVGGSSTIAGAGAGVRISGGSRVGGSGSVMASGGDAGCGIGRGTENVRGSPRTGRWTDRSGMISEGLKWCGAITAIRTERRGSAERSVSKKAIPAACSSRLIARVDERGWYTALMGESLKRPGGHDPRGPGMRPAERRSPAPNRNTPRRSTDRDKPGAKVRRPPGVGRLVAEKY